MLLLIILAGYCWGNALGGGIPRVLTLSAVPEHNAFTVFRISVRTQDNHTSGIALDTLDDLRIFDEENIMHFRSPQGNPKTLCFWGIDNGFGAADRQDRSH